MKPHTKQTVNSLLTKEHEMRDLSNQSFVFNELHNETVLTVEFDPTGEEVVAGGQSGLVKVYSLKSRTLRLSFEKHTEAVNTATFSPDGEVICSGSDDGQIFLWTASNGLQVDQVGLHNDVRILRVAFVPSHSGKIVSMSSHRLVMWDSPLTASAASNGLNIMEFRRAKQSDFICMKLSPNFLAAGTVDNIITIWRLASAEVVQSLPGHTE